LIHRTANTLVLQRIQTQHSDFNPAFRVAPSLIQAWRGGPRMQYKCRSRVDEVNIIIMAEANDTASGENLQTIGYGYFKKGMNV